MPSDAPAPRLPLSDLASYASQSVSVQGWVTHVRSSGKIAFLRLGDGSGSCQCVLERHTPDLESLGRDVDFLKNIQTPFPRITYTDAVELLRSDEVHEEELARLEADRARLADLETTIQSMEAQLSQSSKAWKKEKLGKELHDLQEQAKDLHTEVKKSSASYRTGAHLSLGKRFRRRRRDHAVPALSGPIGGDRISQRHQSLLHEN